MWGGVRRGVIRAFTAQESAAPPKALGTVIYKYIRFSTKELQVSKRLMYKMVIFDRIAIIMLLITIIRKFTNNKYRRYRTVLGSLLITVF